MGKIVTQNPLDVDNDIIGKTFKVTQCEARTHDHGTGCICYLIDREVTLKSRMPSAFCGTASFYIEGADKTVRLSELGLENRFY